MPLLAIAFLEAAALASSLSVDSFAAGFAYGSKKIRIPALSLHVINLICAAVTGLSLFAGALLRPYLPDWLTLAAAFTILFVIGVIKLLDGITKSIIKKHNGLNKQLNISIFNVKFILSLYASPEEADVDASKTISPAEAAALALSLSIDGIAVGFGAALAEVNVWAVVIFSLITNAVAIALGCRLGNKAAEKSKFNISWLGGAVLIFLAFAKFL